MADRVRVNQVALQKLLRGKQGPVARDLGRRAIGIETREAQAEEAARWLSSPVQPVLFGQAS